MIKAKGNGFIMFGLTDINLKKLQEGKPIKFNLSEMGLPSMEVIIIHGKDENTLYQELKQFKSKDAVVHKKLGPNEVN